MVISYNKGKPLHRHIFTDVDSGIFKMFSFNTKKQRRRVKKFSKKFEKCETYWDNINKIPLNYNEEEHYRIIKC